jgi:hypothetical protein
MADKYTNEYSKAFIQRPSELVEAGLTNGRLRQALVTFTAAAELATADDVFLYRLPQGARVMDMRVKSPDWGTTGACNIGWRASVDGVEVADADGFFAALDCNTAAVDAKLGAIAPGWGKKFASPVDIMLKPTAASTALTGLSIVVQIVFVVD